MKAAGTMAMPERRASLRRDAHGARSASRPSSRPRETGRIINVSTGIASVSGLDSTGFEELLAFPGGAFGIAFNVDETEIGVVLLGDHAHLQAGDEVERTGRVMDVGVGEALLGRVIDPLGRPLDGNGPVVTEKRLPIERPAAAIMDRAPVVVPLQTGLKVIDALIPIGRGQRELILGDRQTGKTAIAIDTILNQRGKDVVCIYCAIGQRALRGRQGHQCAARERRHGLHGRGRRRGQRSAGPDLYRALCRHQHRRALHGGRSRRADRLRRSDPARARLPRTLAAARRPPGREAFPGDIFYIHSRLLERATHLRQDLGNGSLTALPIIETEAQDIAAYIPTNLISITDGQIYLSPSLFELGVLPAVDVGRSVSRVGGKAQRAAFRAVGGRSQAGLCAVRGTRDIRPLRRATRRGRPARPSSTASASGPV